MDAPTACFLPAEPAAPRRGWTARAWTALQGRLDPGAAIAFCIVFAAVQFVPDVLNDADTLWHIRVGEWIVDHHAIPAVDPFSFTAGNRPWVLHEWLSEVLLALAFRAGGLPGVMVLTAAAAGLTVGILLATLRRFLAGPFALAALMVAVADAGPSLLARPHLLAWPCLVLWCAGLARARARAKAVGGAPPWHLLPVMTLWVNLHGSFVLGPVLAGAFMVEAALEPGADRKKTLLAWTGFIAASGAAALLNPYGLRLVLFPFHLLGMTSLARINEWQPSVFDGWQPLEIAILVLLALGLSGELRVPWVRLLLLLGLIHGALHHRRHESLLGFIGALILAEPLGASLGYGVAAALGPVWRGVARVAAVLAVIAPMVRGAVPLAPQRSGADFAALLDRLPEGLRALPVLNEYGLGGNLIFNGVRPFVDGRADMYGDAFLQRYIRVTAPDPAELSRVLDEYRIAWTIFPEGRPILRELDREPGWRRIIEADGIVVHGRDDISRARQTPGHKPAAE